MSRFLASHAFRPQLSFSNKPRPAISMQRHAGVNSSASWLAQAITQVESDLFPDTDLLRVSLPQYPGITLYLKDESTHETGSLKHRLARSLFLYALCNGLIRQDTLLIEASSGSTAVSEAYFARLLGLRFIAVVPISTARAKLEAIREHGGEIHAVDDPRQAHEEANRLATETGGLYLDQFTNAERVTDWRRDNIAESIFSQMREEEYPVPAWIVAGAGTGGTSATIGRYIRYQKHSTRLCVADPAQSVFHRHFRDSRVTVLAEGCGSIIEGIGRPKVEPSFIPSVIDRMIAVEDGQSIGAMRALSNSLGRLIGGSTGTSLWACATLIREMAQAGETGSVVTLLCDDGSRYEDTYYDNAWLADRGIEWRASADAIRDFLCE